MTKLIIGIIGAVLIGGGLAFAAVHRSHKDGVERISAVAYLDARRGFLNSYREDSNATRKAMADLVRNVGQRCGGALVGAPADNAGTAGTGLTDRERIGIEIINTVDAVQSRSRLRAVESFAESVGRLKWKDRRVERLVRAFAAYEVRLHNVTVPNICKVSAEWVARRYRSLPAHVGELPSGEYGPRLISALMALGCTPLIPPEEAVLAEVKRAGDTQVQRLVKATRRTEAEVKSDEVKNAMPYVVDLERELGLPTRDDDVLRQRDRESRQSMEVCSGRPELSSKESTRAQQ